MNKNILLPILLQAICLSLFAQRDSMVAETSSLNINFGDSIKDGTIVIKTKFYYDSALQENIVKVLDSSKITDGKFVYSYNYTLSPLLRVDIYFYDINKNVYRIGAGIPNVNMYNSSILLDKGNYYLTLKNIRHPYVDTEISGSKENAIALIYSADGFVENKFVTAEGKIIDISFVERFKDSEFLMKQLFETRFLYSLDTLDLFYKRFNEDVRSSILGKRISSYLQEEKDIWKNGVKKNFNFYDTTQTVYEFKDFIADKKLGVIIFWASWCAPCRAEMPYYKKLFEKFNKDVAFVNITIDSDYSAWKKALNDENMNWLNLSGFARKTLNRNVFNIDFVPQIYVVDTAGNILYGKNQFAITSEIEKFVNNYINNNKYD